jgi:DNA polymerase II small subunit
MSDETYFKELTTKLSQARIFLSGDARTAVVDGIDVDILVSKIIEGHKTSQGAVFVDSEEIGEIIRDIMNEKNPEPIEVARKAEFVPIAAEFDAEYVIHDVNPEQTSGDINDFVTYFRDRMEKIRTILETNRNNVYGFVKTLESIKSFTNGREVALVGIVTSRIVTKNGNMMAILEDETGEVKVMFMNGSNPKSKELFEKAGHIANDEVIAIRGKVSSIFVIANEIVWPDIPIKEKKFSEKDTAIAFLSDVHVGSKLFMDRNFSYMIRWLNGSIDKYAELAGKVKYVIMAGDVADGIGVYPGQDRDLAIQDVYAQYKLLFNLIDAIPDYVHVFILPGNHDAVQRAEPQPPLSADVVGDFKKDNVHIVSNPAYMKLDGLDVLSYHGTSLDSIISAIPNNSYARPEKAMVELLKRRHLSPIYGGNVIVPSKKDNMVIDKVPDILHMGHIHKNGLTEYHGVDVVNSGTWQGRTDFQIRQGHVPSPCVMPVFEMKSHRFTSINFGEGL